MIKKIFALGMSLRVYTSVVAAGITSATRWCVVTRAAAAGCGSAFLCAVLFLALPLAADAASTVELRSIGASSTDGGVLVTLDTSSVTPHRLFTLEHPYRVVIDLHHTRLAAGARAPATKGPIDDIRTGKQAGGTLRVVIQLGSQLPARGEWLTSSGERGERFVVAIGKNAQIASQTQSVPAANSPPKPVRAAHAPVESDRDIVVAVDAGHGGQDPGAIGRSGTREKDVVLAIARALAARINAEPGMRAVLTRDKDEFVALRDRMRRARAAKADLFISVHADSIRDRSITGASVYVLSDRGASSEAARWLAERENAADLMGGVRLDDKDNGLASVLLDLSQTASLSASMTAAERVLHALDRVGEVRKPRVQQAAFVVLKSPDIPSMLVETAYISNPSEEARLRTGKLQGKLADAMLTGLRGYFELNPPPGTRFAQIRRATLAGVVESPAAP